MFGYSTFHIRHTRVADVNGISIKYLVETPQDI